jgi:hypothetical protein
MYDNVLYQLAVFDTSDRDPLDLVERYLVAGELARARTFVRGHGVGVLRLLRDKR